MGRITVSDNTIQVDPAKEVDPPADQDRLTTGARFYLDGDEIIVALGRTQAPEPMQLRKRPQATAVTTPTKATTGCSPSTRAASKRTSLRAGSTNTPLNLMDKKMEPFSFPGMDSGPKSAYVAEMYHLRSAIKQSTFITSRSSPSHLAQPRATTFMA